MPRPRLLFAQTLLRVEDWAGAEKQYRWLLRTTGKSEVLRVKLARCLFKQDKFAEAHSEICAALVLNPVWHDALMVQSRIYEAQEDWTNAAASLEKAIAADGRENFADLEALLRLWEVSHRAGAGEETLAQTAERMVSIVPLPTSGADLKADERVARAVLILCDRASELSEAGKDGLASALLYVAARIEGADADAQSRMADLQARTFVLFEARQTQSDVLIDGALRDSIFLKYLDRRGSAAGRQTRLENVLADLQAEINNQPKALSTAIDYLKKEYPRLAEAEAAFLEVLIARALRRMEVLNPKPELLNSSGAGGGIMPKTPGDDAPSAEAPPPSGGGGIFRWLRGNAGSGGG